MHPEQLTFLRFLWATATTEPLSPALAGCAFILLVALLFTRHYE